jgi:hypothetical protein
MRRLNPSRLAVAWTAQDVDRRRPVADRRPVTALGRWIVALHRQYYVPALKPVVWLVFIVTAILQVVLVNFAR